MRNKLIHWLIWLFILGIILSVIILFSLSVGSSGIPAKKIFSSIIYSRCTTEYSIIFDIRLPRIILGFATGGALSLAGVILQGIFRNPLVEPYTLGISGGAALGVCLNILFKLNEILGFLSLPLSGFTGAITVIVLLYFFSLKREVFKIHEILLTGVMISFISSSLIMLIMALSRTEDLHSIVFWVMGSLEEPNWLLIKLMVIVSISGLFISYLFCLDLNAISLGEEEAAHLGIDVEKVKKILFLLASILTGFSVSITGMVGFVGLVVPHFVRIFAGTDHKIVLISSFLSGAGFLIFCDTLSRTIISPVELPIGVITGILGGSLFIYALTRRSAFFGEK